MLSSHSFIDDRGDRPDAGAVLSVSFGGARTDAVDRLSFGRRAGVVLDADNRHLDAQAGRFVADRSHWYLQNVSSRLHLWLVAAGGFIAELPPETSIEVPFGSGLVRFSAGPLAYELTYRAPTGRSDGLSPYDGTVTPGRWLTPSQIAFAAALGEIRLQGRAGPLPTYAAIAERWAMTPRAVAAILGQIRDRLEQRGVTAIGSHEELVGYLVANRLVTLDDVVDRHRGGSRADGS